MTKKQKKMLSRILINAVMLAALYFLPLDRTLCMAILILASCPAGSLTAVLAKQYDTEGELASQAVAHSTLSILISVPLVLSLGSTLLGI